MFVPVVRGAVPFGPVSWVSTSLPSTVVPMLRVVWPAAPTQTFLSSIVGYCLTFHSSKPPSVAFVGGSVRPHFVYRTK